MIKLGVCEKLCGNFMACFLSFSEIPQKIFNQEVELNRTSDLSVWNTCPFFAVFFDDML